MHTGFMSPIGGSATAAGLHLHGVDVVIREGAGRVPAPFPWAPARHRSAAHQAGCAVRARPAARGRELVRLMGCLFHVRSLTSLATSVRSCCERPLPALSFTSQLRDVVWGGGPGCGWRPQGGRQAGPGARLCIPTRGAASRWRLGRKLPLLLDQDVYAVCRPPFTGSLCHAFVTCWHCLNPCLPYCRS